MIDGLKAALVTPLLCAAALSVAIPVAASSSDAPFIAQVDRAMAKMMAGMTIKPSGSVDDDFVASMVRHHQGAIEMAEAELRYGENDQLKRIAQEIIVTQQQEIAAMRLAVGEPLPPSAPAPDQTPSELAGQAPFAASAPDIPVTHRDRVYSAEQFSNTISVTDPVDNKLLGVIRLGDPQPGNYSPLYRGQLLVHGLGFSPGHRTLVVVSIGSDSVAFIDTATNTVQHITYVGRSPHEAFFTPDGSEVWVTVRGENYVSVLDANTYEEKMRITVPNGPGMTIFSPDGKYGYVCSSFNPETVVVAVADHRVVGHVPQASPFCPNIAATPDGKQVWFTLKDTGKVQVFDAQPPFELLKTLTTGPITNHVNIVRNANGQFAYVTIGGLNEVKVFRTSDFSQVATIPVGKLPHGLWPSGDGTRVYVGLENGDRMTAIDTLTNTVIATSPIGQAVQAVVYVPDAVPSGTGTEGLQPLGLAGQATHFTLVARANGSSLSEKAPTSVTLFDQGIVQTLEAAVTGLRPMQHYVLALSRRPDGGGTLEPISAFMTNAAGAQIVNTTGPIRQIVHGEDRYPRRYFVIAPGTMTSFGTAVQLQAP